MPQTPDPASLQPVLPLAVERVLGDLWRRVGLPQEALAMAHINGTDPVLPSSFAVGTAASATICAAALAAAEFHHLRGAARQGVSVSMRHATAEFRSERYLRVDNGAAPEIWDKIAGAYPTRGGGWVRLHTNFPHHRDGVLALLGSANDRESVAAALLNWDAEAFEDAASQKKLVVAAMRSFEEWDAHPQGAAIAGQPLLTIEKIGDAPPGGHALAGRPLEGIRVLDMTRIIAGPVCGRTLAAYGADVMMVTSPGLPFVLPLVIDSGRGKRSCHIDLHALEGHAALRGLLEKADVVVQGYRPGGITELGFGPDDAARMRPGIVYATLSAYGPNGPWARKRGFDSLVQTATGFNESEARQAGHSRPRPLPAQVLDHASGYLLALGIMTALMRNQTEGGSWHVRVSLAQTGHWFRRLGRYPGGFGTPDPTLEDVADLMERSTSGFGELNAVSHSAIFEDTPAFWRLPSVPLGTDPPRW